MANMFSGKSDKYIPKTLDECTQQDATATNLHFWAERLESWGKILFIALIVIGILSTIIDTLAAADVDEDMAFITLMTTAISWGLYAFIEYCAYHVLALLISSLALITQNSIISANVALYEAANNSAPAPQHTPGNTPVHTPVQKVVNRTASSAGGWVCACGRENAAYVSSCACGLSKHESAQKIAESNTVNAEIRNGEKICPKCGTAQKEDRQVCWFCGVRFEN